MSKPTPVTPAQAVSDAITGNQTALAGMAALTLTLAGQNLAAAPKVFSTGSRGYYAGGKVTLPDGTRLQVSLNAVVIGSKPRT